MKHVTSLTDELSKAEVKSEDRPGGEKEEKKATFIKAPIK